MEYIIGAIVTGLLAWWINTNTNIYNKGFRDNDEAHQGFNERLKEIEERLDQLEAKK